MRRFRDGALDLMGINCLTIKIIEPPTDELRSHISKRGGMIRCSTFGEWAHRAGSLQQTAVAPKGRHQ